MDATLLLCDWAETINGKLYVMGGGWNVVPANQPLPVAVGALIHVPWDQTNRPIEVSISLRTEDGGEAVSDGRAMTVTGKLEVGRPPGAKKGAPFNVPFAVRYSALKLPPGGYRFEVVVDGEPVAQQPFQVVGDTK